MVMPHTKRHLVSCIELEMGTIYPQTIKPGITTETQDT